MPDRRISKESIATVAMGRQISKVIEERMTTFHKENKKIIEDTIKVVVNGKIDRLTGNLNDLDNKFDTYVAKDLVWKQDAETYRLEKTDPIVETRKNFKWLGDLGRALLGWIILIGSALVASFFMRDKFLK